VATWTDILKGIDQQPQQEAAKSLDKQLQTSLKEISALYGGTNVMDLKIQRYGR